MRELDAVLQAFLESDYQGLSEDDKQRFAAILELPDPDLHGYLVRRNEPDDPDIARLVARIRSSVHPNP
jgi:antitoxin CptB